MSVTVIHGDMLAELPNLAADSVDSVVCDPPYHLTSIVKRFGADGAAPAKDRDGLYARASAGFMGMQWDGGDIAFCPETWAEVLRVLKPGGYLLAFASTRGFGRMSVAIEGAGFIQHPFIAWIFGSGFPKATRVKDPAWDGWRYGGQALKPAIEPIFMGQKPFSEKTGTANILKHGTGAINIDGCRVEGTDGTTTARTASSTANTTSYGKSEKMGGLGSPLGRWPANVIHDGSEEVLAAFPATTHEGRFPGKQSRHDASSWSITGGEISAGRGMCDSGSAARFFYSAKADQSDRLGSKHPTVKPVDLMAYLCRLVTPPGGTVLDPFAGSGSTGMACLREGFDAVLIEREAEYVADIKRRIAHVSGEDAPLFGISKPVQERMQF